MSSKSKTSIFVMALSVILIFVLLLIQFVFFKVSNLGFMLISDILPTSGLNIFYSLIGGSGSLRYYEPVWSPYITAVAAVLEIVVFMILAVRAYAKRESI